MSKLDKYDISRIITKDNKKPNQISVGVTWVDGRILFKPNNKSFDKQGQAYYGICHFSQGIFLFTPRDYEKATMITTILVSPLEDFCDRAYTCLHFKCPHNRFNRGMFESEFKDCNALSLGLPENIGEEPLWFNGDKWKNFWPKLILHGSGGNINYDKEKAEKILNG